VGRPERQLERDGTALTDFAADLRRLRDKAGNPPYRAMAVLAHFSSTTLSDAAGGRRLPSLAVTLAYVRVCDGDIAEWERRWHTVAAERAGAAPEPGGTDGTDAPYRGLSAYGVGDAGRFFGRGRLVDELVDRLGARRFVAVFGASGSGKSSLLRAGLVPRLSEHLLFTPGAHPVEECAIAVARLTGHTPGAVLRELTADPRNLHRLVRQAETDVVVIVDQFEEVFTLCSDPAERALFIAMVTAAVHGEDSRCRVVLGVRADFYAHCGRHADLVDAMRDAQVTVGPMTGDELRRAITGPVALVGGVVENALLVTLVADGHGRVGVLPLLSHALLETWHRRRGNTLTLAGFQATGGIDGALAKSAERVFGDFDDEQRLACRDMFRRLTALGAGTEDTKRRVAAAELDDDPHTATVLERFTEARLLVRAHDGVEIAHEALIRAWPRLLDWLTADRDGQRAHRELTEAAALWEQHDRDAGVLLRGNRLTSLQDWTDRGAVRPNSRERTFLDASITATAREHLLVRRRTRVLSALVALLTVVAVVAVVVALRAADWQRTATDERDVAVAAQLARTATELVDTRPAIAVQLGVAAYEMDQSPATRQALIAMVAASGRLTVNSGNPPSSLAADGSLVGTADAGADRTRLATVGPSATVTAGTMTGGAAAPLLSTDHRVAVTSDRHATLRLWHIADPGHPVLLSALPTPALAVAFVGDRLLVAHDLAETSNPRSSLGERWQLTTRRLWDLTDGHHPRDLGTLPIARGPVTGSGRTMATVGTPLLGEHGWGSTLTSRRIATAGAVAVTSFAVNMPGLSALALSVDARTLVAGDDNGSLTVFDVSGRREPWGDYVHRGAVQSVALSPGGRTMATSGYRDGKVLVWDLSDQAKPRKVIELTSGQSDFRALAFTPDGRTLVAYGQDGVVGTLWRWHLDVTAAAAEACDAGHRRITAEEWARYAPDVPFRPPCR
jgi:conflict system STAND superfamily ATPase/WD40 domain-containing protein